MTQIGFFNKQALHYGGKLLNTRRGRSGGRPIDTHHSMHLVLRSSKAKGEFSFRKPKNSRAVLRIVRNFSHKYGIKIYSFANVGNHIHLHIHIRNRNAYKPFIRAVTASIAMAISGASRWKKSTLGKFWDCRPFTRVVIGYKSFLNLRDYVELNTWEGRGFTKVEARFLVASEQSYHRP